MSLGLVINLGLATVIVGLSEVEGEHWKIQRAAPSSLSLLSSEHQPSSPDRTPPRITAALDPLRHIEHPRQPPQHSIRSPPHSTMKPATFVSFFALGVSVVSAMPTPHPVALAEPAGLVGMSHRRRFPSTITDDYRLIASHNEVPSDLEERQLEGAPRDVIGLLVQVISLVKDSSSFALGEVVTKLGSLLS